jgi:hypothetical protein
LLTICLLLVAASGCQRQIEAIRGTVVDEDGPIAGARVRIQTDSRYVVTDEAGQFELAWPPSGQPIRLTAWAPGYFIEATDPVDRSSTEVTIKLFRHGDEDHPQYQWISAFASAGSDANCQNCHSDASALLPFEEWLLDSHSQTLENHRFVTMYQGTNLAGETSPLTRYAWNRDYGRFQLPPNPLEAYYGPGYQLDFPNTQGNCAACHAPAAAINAPYQTDPTDLTGVEAESIGCDFCHKIWDVWLDEDSQLPRPNMPGVLSFEFRRPGEEHQFFAGPFDDVAPGEDTYAPIQSESAYCAPCHHGTFWDTTIYNSYGEWLASPYSEAEDGQTCQDCHMPSRGASQFATSEAGGLLRDPERIRSHKMRGLNDVAFMQDAISLSAEAGRQGQAIQVQVTVENDNTGHKVPSDSPLRNLILLVEATDASGQPLSLLQGERLPDWAGNEAGQPGHYAGKPGRVFALLLKERWTGVSPTGAYWNPVEVVSDTRLAPLSRDESSFTFEAAEVGSTSLKIELIFRRVFAELAEQKGWGLEDTQLQMLTLEVP